MMAADPWEVVSVTPDDVPPPVPEAEFGTVENPGSATPMSLMDMARAKIRGRVEDLPGLLEFIVEAAPATAGTMKGAAAGGALAGPPGAVVGGMVGGLAGEFAAQETGLAPESKTALAISGAAPAAGPAVAKTAKLATRLGGKVVSSLPPLKSAAGQMSMRESAKEFSSIGAEILSRQRGAMAQSAEELYTAARRAGAVVTPDQLGGTRTALEKLSAELAPLAEFPEAQRAAATVQRVLNTIGDDTVSFDKIVDMRNLVGAAVDHVQRAGGIQLGTAKQVFKSLAGDIDTIAKGASSAAGAAQVAQTAAQRAKLEFSVKEFDAAVSKFTWDVSGSDAIELNVKNLQKWLRDTTDPRSDMFNKNFTDAMKDELPALKARLQTLTGIADTHGPGGPGSLVLRGISAQTGRAMVGAVLGGATMGPLGAGVGAFAGANLPEMMSAVFMSPRGAKLIEMAANAGKGEINARQWAAIAQVVGKMAGHPADRDDAED